MIDLCNMDEELEIWSVRNVAEQSYTYHRQTYYNAGPRYYRISNGLIEEKAKHNGHWELSVIMNKNEVKTFLETHNIEEVTDPTIIRLICDDSSYFANIYDLPRRA